MWINGIEKSCVCTETLPCADHAPGRFERQPYQGNYGTFRTIYRNREPAYLITQADGSKHWTYILKIAMDLANHGQVTDPRDNQFLHHYPGTF